VKWDERTKKADVAEHSKVFDHVGLLANQPPDHWSSCLFSSRPTTSSEAVKFAAFARQLQLYAFRAI